MRVVIQRVQQASVNINGAVYAEIKRDLLIFAGIHKDDLFNNTGFLADKILSLRIFPDQDNKMNRSIIDIQGSLLIISQFTLYADTSSGNRPDFIQAAPPEKAFKLHLDFIARLKKGTVSVATGIFGETMQIELINDGPVTIIMDSK